MKQRKEAVKGCGGEFLGSREILLVEVSNLALGVCEICCRFPGVRAFFIAFPFNSVLELLTKDMGICDLVNFVLFFTFHCDGVRRWRLVKTVVSIGSETIDIENRMELQIVRQVLFEVQVANTLNDFKRTKLTRA
jgi:hypothetical protein